ncbi:phosphatase PAP2 family protein [Marinomonas agarivorans]|nr:phosphatase PAP2 family protein [Marinomonas agarivorans]
MNILESIHNKDVQTFYWCMARKHRALMTSLSRFISHSADGHLYAVLALFLYYIGKTDVLTMLGVAFCFERILYFIMKKGFKRNRPSAALENFRSFIQPSDQFSFPSGHTSGAFLVAYFLTMLLPEFYMLWYSWAVCVGLSRVFLGVHFPTDTAMGAILGTMSAILIVGALS